MSRRTIIRAYLAGLGRTGVILGFCLIAGCGWFKPKEAPEQTLADLPRAQMPKAERTVAVMDIDRIERSYRQALEVTESPLLRQQILVRLADLEMTRSEQQQFAATEMRRFYDRPIALYEEVLALQSQAGQPSRGIAIDQLRYKLAKAYALDGRNEEAAQVLDLLAEQHPDSPFIAETQFRRAEKAFAEGDYRRAESFYEHVVSGDNPALRQNALYMQGWAQFKRSDYELALQSFAGVMDQLLRDAQSEREVPAVMEQLPQASRNLISDTLRVMALSLSYLDGPQALAVFQQEQGARPYQHLLYEQLGSLYLEQQRFSDSAKTYEYFVEHNPQSDFAPEFSIKTIVVYEQGGFPSLILPAKQEFIERYGVLSSYWAEREGNLSETARAYLHGSLQELAQYEHAEAQRLKVGDEPAAASAAYGRAARWYREFVQTFPHDSQASAMTFLLAEALYEAGDLAEALAAYEQVAYRYSDPIHGAEAGYSAILLAQELIAAVPATDNDARQHWQGRKITNAMRFAEHFPADERAVYVLTQAASELLAQGLFDDAAAVAAKVIAWQPPASAKLRFTSWLVSGHSRYELQEYATAEQAYWQVLELLPTQEPGAGVPTEMQVRERLAASIYQQAQAALAADSKAEAVALLLRVTEVTPDTDTALKARYDAGHYLFELEQWSEAEAVLLSFRERYPQDPLTATIPAKLVAIYQAQGQWQQAADELVLMERFSADPEVKRQSLLLGAELYEKSGNPSQAIALYRRYVADYPQPFMERVEAQYRLSELYGAAGDSKQRQLWLQNIIDSDQRAGAARTARSRYLAAGAAAELARPVYDEFVRIPLRLPLKNSLQRKRAALETALKAQERVLTYEVAEFTTQASFMIGEIYAQLSRDLMNSQRPTNLDVLELEQYDMLLEEQAYPFEEKAIEIHEANARRARTGVYDQWVERSFSALATLLPARYHKQESQLEVAREIH